MTKTFPFSAGGGLQLIPSPGTHTNTNGFAITVDGVSVAANGTATVGQNGGSIRIDSPLAGSVLINYNASGSPQVAPAFLTGWHPGQNGLSRWIAGLGQVQKTGGGRGMGGVDVVCIGDSKTEVEVAGSGVGAQYSASYPVDYFVSKWTHYLKVRLQKRYNPPGVQGGYGYVPVFTGFADATYPGALHAIFSKFGTVNERIQSTAMRSVDAAAGANGVFLTLDPTSVPAEFRYNITGIDYVAAKGSGIGTLRYDVKAGGTGGAALIGGGDSGKTGGFVANDPTGQYGIRWAVRGITRTVAQTIQIAAPASTGTIRFDGVILYDGDEDCGVRVHNLGYYGQVAALFCTQANGGPTDTSNNANFDRWGDGVPGVGSGANQAKLFTFNWITNDVGQGLTPVTPLPTFVTQYSEQIDRALALASKPSVILIIPQFRYIADDATRAAVKANYDLFRAAIYGIAATRPDVSILDLYEYTGFDSNQPGGFIYTYGWNGSGAHGSDVAQRSQAEIMDRVLTAGSAA